MKLTDHIPADPEGTAWDVVVIGTGAGGGTAGFNLARLGRSVLFLERGGMPEMESDSSQHELLEVVGTVDWECPQQAEASTASLLVGCGIGGTSSYFAMVMDRFRPVDFGASSVSHRPGSASLSESWPIQYEDLEPYYREAESLFRIRGTDDPLASTHATLLTPLQPSETEVILHDALAESGLHPYRLHYAREHVPGCNGCPGTLCPHKCRNDAARMCVLPAILHHGANVLPNCHVLKLEAHGRTVHQAICRWNGRYIAIRARTFVLALNALLTPALLLRSASDYFPAGLGNTSGMVGRNLMLHVSDHLSVTCKRLRGGLLNGLLRNGLSLNDFYVHNGFKLGNIHAHAMDVTTLRGWFGIPIDESTGALLFSTIVEDFPYPENRVTPKTGSETDVLWQYKYPEELKLRSQMIVKAFAASLQPICDLRIREPSGILNGSHMCGTCRFGNDPSSSVLDRDNRLHDIDNVYVVDASFFPSSGGINPSLTIAANSLRVSSLIASR